MEFPSRDARTALTLAYEVLKKVPANCPSKAAAVGASVLLVLASVIISRFAITSMEHAGHVRSEDICGECEIRKSCRASLAK